MEDYKKLVDDAINGDIDALEVYIKLNQDKKELEELMKNVLDSAIYEFDKFEEKTVKHKGFEIRKTSSAKYYFDHIQAWNNKKDEMKKIEELSKQVLKIGESLVLEETGEVIEPAIVKYSSYGLAIKPLK